MARPAPSRAHGHRRHLQAPIAPPRREDRISCSRRNCWATAMSISISLVGASCMLGGGPRSLPGAECSSDDGRCLGRERARHDVVPEVVCSHSQGCVEQTGVRQSPHGHEALVATLRRTTIRRCRVLSGSAERVDDPPQADRRRPCRAVSRTRRPRSRPGSPVIRRGTRRVTRWAQRAS